MNEYTEIGTHDLTPEEKNVIDKLIAEGVKSVADAFAKYEQTREAAAARKPKLLPSQDEPLLDLRESVRQWQHPGTVLMCSHAKLPIKIRPGEQHHCPGVTLNCWCDPYEIPEAQYLSAVQGLTRAAGG